MKEVSCRAFDFLFRALKKKGLPPEVLAEGTGYSVEHLRNRHERIEWTAFVRVNANAGKIWNEDELLTLSTGFLQSPFVRSIFTPAGLIFSARDLYRWALGERKGGGGQMFLCVKNAYREMDERHGVLDLTLPPDYPPCPEFFVISKGVFSQLPGMVGLRAAGVTMTPIPSGMHYEIVFPEERGVLPAIRRGVTWPFKARTVAKELKDTHETLLTRYQELEDYKQNLEKKVETRTEELSRTVRQLEEAQAARSRLFANINHEIRTPLSNILLASARMREGGKPEDVENIEAGARRLLRMIDGLLVLAAGQENRLRLRSERIDLAKTVQSVTEEFKITAKQRGISLGVNAPDRCLADADESALERIVANLVSNALKFTPSGGTVEVKLESKNGQGTELSVRDTGIGLDDEFKSRIFGRFEQGRAPVHAGSQGSGIGLSIVKELAEAHQGSVSVESAMGRGTTFRVKLPPAAAFSPIAGPVEPSNTLKPTAADFGMRASDDVPEVMEPAAGRATILVAEDDPDLRRSIGSLLARDYRVLLAKDGLAALDLARKHLPDMLVSDVGMPGMDGFELTTQFLETEGLRLAPVLLLTAYGEVSDRIKGFQSGAVDYIPKPFNPEELRARVRAQLHIRALVLRLHEGEKLAALGILSSGLAHELRNPANGISNAIEPLKSILPPDVLKPDVPSGMLFKVIEDCATQISNVSRQLLGLRRPGELMQTKESWPKLLRRSLSLTGTALDRVKVQEETLYDGEISCAAPLFVQVLVNLLDNGAHAAGRDGWVRVKSYTENDSLVVEVSDSGPGVPVALREQIFQPFFTTKAPGVGTGLGLTTAREIMLRHDGSLEVKPAGSGTLFRVELPLNSRMRDVAAAAARSAP